MIRQVSYQDFLQSIVNQQHTIRDTVCEDKEENSVYFILAIDGINFWNQATIKDVGGNTITIRRSEGYEYPLRIDGGFTITATKRIITVIYSKVSKGN